MTPTAMTCLCRAYGVYKWRDHRFETQRAGYNCGPVAIANGLRYQSRPVGPAVHRQIVAHCKPRAVHPDGFRGTQVANMDAALRRYWPGAIRVSGRAACSVALKSMVGCILLFRRNRHTLHYVFVHYDGVYHLENEERGSLATTKMTRYLREPTVWVLYR